MADERRKSDQDLPIRVRVLELGQRTILNELAKNADKVAENTEATLRVDTNTAPLVRLTKQIEIAGKAFSWLGEALRILVKTMIYGGLTIGIVFAGIYALTHEGHLPEWFRSLLRLYKEVE